MPSPLVECIPNFSEARRPEVVEAILAAINAVPGVHVLDRHSDLDHNRTVVTFVGSPAAVEEAAFQGIARAAQLIDLNLHTGAHPRMGATDVVPFVPISDITMQDCVETYRASGETLMQGVHLNNQFIGTGYNVQIRMLGDFGSSIYTIHSVEDTAASNS